MFVLKINRIQGIMKQFVRFFISSLSSSVIDLVLFSVFCRVLRSNTLGNVPYIILATVFARICSALYNFYINYKLVFLSRQNIKITLIKYVILAIVQMILSALLVNFLYPLFGGMEIWIKMVVDVALFFVSFLIQKIHVY